MTYAQKEAIPDPSRPSDNKGIYWMCVAFFVVFLIGGVATAWFLLYQPFKRYQEAQAWPQTPCRITQSEVVTSLDRSSQSGRTTEMYSAAIAFAYEYNGTRMVANTPHISGFTSSRSSSRQGWEDYIKLYPRDKETVCFVNPADPAQAFLDRSFQASDFLLGFVMTIVFTGCAFLFRFIGNRLT